VGNVVWTIVTDGFTGLGEIEYPIGLGWWFIPETIPREMLRWPSLRADRSVKGQQSIKETNFVNNGIAFCFGYGPHQIRSQWCTANESDMQTG
jgi:hypothetical protein